MNKKCSICNQVKFFKNIIKENLCLDHKELHSINAWVTQHSTLKSEEHKSEIQNISSPYLVGQHYRINLDKYLIEEYFEIRVPNNQ